MMTRMVNANGQTLRWNYDKLGRVTKHYWRFCSDYIYARPGRTPRAFSRQSTRTWFRQFLTARDARDEHWRGQWHAAPGVRCRNAACDTKGDVADNGRLADDSGGTWGLTQYCWCSG
ncbi:MAG: hypothetical protein LC130_37215 [Bryobacterales bacterium]|nr:hypothetical protein [Bryobacterales bacterium]